MPVEKKTNREDCQRCWPRSGRVSRCSGTDVIILDQVEEILTNPIFRLPDEVPGLIDGIVIALKTIQACESSWDFVLNMPRIYSVNWISMWNGLIMTPTIPSTP